MKEFSTLVAEKWNIAEEIAAEACACFEGEDSFYFVNDYNPLISASLDLTTVSEIFAFLRKIADLAPKKKRVLNALTKSGMLDEEQENRIKLCTNPVELDDMLLPLRPNPRSRGQLAGKKGLSELVDAFITQEAEQGSVEDLAEPFVNPETGLNSIEGVIANLKDILAERFAYDDTVRSMVREFGYDDGFFEIIPRNKKDKEFAKYRGKMIPVAELTPEQTLEFLTAEQDKHIRFKHGVQLFRISELLRHHFINNPDFVGFDLLCEVIDDCWQRMLEPMVERHVKDEVRQNAEDWAMKKVSEEIDRKQQEVRESGSMFAVGISQEQDLVIIAFAAEGNLLGATKEKIRRLDKDFFCKRLQQFFSRYRPAAIIIDDGEHAATAEGIVSKTLGAPPNLKIMRFKPTAAVGSLAQSEWMMRKYADLDVDMRTVYAAGILYLKPFSLIPEMGVHLFDLHPLQKFIAPDRINGLISRKVTERKLHSGIPLAEVCGSVIEQLAVAPDDLLQEVRKQAIKQVVATKSDLQKVPGMTDSIYRNIAGYVTCPSSENFLDRTTVHPSQYEWVAELTQQLNISIETLVANPEQLRGAKGGDFVKALFIEQRLIPQLQTGQAALSASIGKPRRRLLLTEIEEGVILQGRVTNITPFGVFIDINAICDGLVHISHLADGYVESAEQVVRLNDRVDVRVLSVDRKKKRISLSMKGLGDRSPKVRPSKGQLSTLADHFKNR
jgi:uncharacterized protein